MKELNEFIMRILALEVDDKFKAGMLSQFSLNLACNYGDHLPQCLDGFYWYKDNETKKKCFESFVEKFIEQYEKYIKEEVESRLEKHDDIK